jgi:hypothetical protein
VLEPDPTTRAAPTSAQRPPTELSSPHALQILSTEHWSLLAARGLVYTEATARTSIFVAALSGSVVALALVAQATDFGTGFVAFALVLLPVVFFIGATTFIRLGQVNWEDARWMQGMNRIRNAYLDLAPELEPYFVTSKYDDDIGILRSAMAMREPPGPAQAFASIPGVVAVIASVVAGATGGIAAVGLDLGTAGALIVGGVLFVASLAGFGAYAQRQIGRQRGMLDSLFPTPASDRRS